MQTDAYAYTSANIAKGTTVCLQVVYSVHELTEQRMGYTEFIFIDDSTLMFVFVFGSYVSLPIMLRQKYSDC